MTEQEFKAFCDRIMEHLKRDDFDDAVKERDQLNELLRPKYSLIFSGGHPPLYLTNFTLVELATEHIDHSLTLMGIAKPIL
jgi:hypothetical protein